MAENSKIEWTTHTFNPCTDGKLIPDYPCYCVTPDGKVWTRFKHMGRRYPRVVGTTWIEKAPCASKKGHLRVELHSLGGFVKPKKFFVHVLVLEAFTGPRPEGMEACHADGNPANNHVGNLRWDTKKANWADRKKHGRGCEGEKNPGGKKLTADDARTIRNMRHAGNSLMTIAFRFGISCAMVSKIAKNQAWSHISG